MLLKDPYQDRVVKEVPLPPSMNLEIEDVYEDNNLNWQKIKTHLENQGNISKQLFMKIINTSLKIISKEPNILMLNDPLTLIGDIHGQFYDLIKIINSNTNFQKNKLLFLGDYVDRGQFSIEVIILILSLKICYPNNIYLLRGNHECRSLTQFFNFYEETLSKFDQEVYNLIMQLFDNLPLGSIINNSFIAIHGGISPGVKNYKELNKINRNIEIPKEGVICDLMWSDPIDSNSGVIPKEYIQNDQRGCSYIFGKNAVKNFLQTNNLISIIRGHEIQVEGYKMYNWNSKEFPDVITIFSAPNYCDIYNNKGAILNFENSRLDIQQFNYNVHPYVLPNQLDIFSWSIPFVIEKISEMFIFILNQSDHNLDSQDKQQIEEIKQYQNKLSNKLKFVQKIHEFQKSKMVQHNNILNKKGLCIDQKIQNNLDIENKSLFDIISKFSEAKQLDQVNEMMPKTK